MKKTLALAILLLATLTPVAFGQAMLNIKQYAEYFGFTNGVIVPDDDFIFRAPRVERTGEISNLEGRERAVDTPLEFALFSYYAASRINIRPPEADAVLPAGNPRQADLLLGAAVLQELQVLRFITGRGNATRAEVEAFYRNGVRGLVSQIVDEQARGRTLPSGNLENIKRIITDFYLNPNTTTYNVLLDTYRRYGGLGGQGNPQSRETLLYAIDELSPVIARAIVNMVTPR